VSPCRSGTSDLSLSLPDHDVERFLHTPPDAVLCVRNAKFCAQGLDAGLGPLIAEHAQVREHMVLNLIVQPALRGERRKNGTKKMR
jgi:hypothetical protein